jgi:hypothetical protein
VATKHEQSGAKVCAGGSSICHLNLTPLCMGTLSFGKIIHVVLVD